MEVTSSEPDSMCCTKNVPPNPPRLTLDYATTETNEGKLKAEIISSLKGGSLSVGAGALGLGGVGKTCALRGLADDKQIMETVLGGILYIQLGNDSHLSDVLSGMGSTANAHECSCQR